MLVGWYVYMFNVTWLEKEINTYMHKIVTNFTLHLNPTSKRKDKMLQLGSRNFIFVILLPVLFQPDR